MAVKPVRVRFDPASPRTFGLKSDRCEIAVRSFLLLPAAALLAGCMPILPPEQYSALPTLPYAACGDIAGLRNNLTAAPEPSPWSDAQLHALGARCLAGPVALAPPAARY